MLLWMLASCKKDEKELPVITDPVVTGTPVGTPIGTPVSKTIGAAGGELASADGKIRIIIPAGALAAEKNISIQPVTKQLPSALGISYRLSPHGEQFALPVTLVFNYDDQDLEGTLPEFLDIAYQDDKGVWQALTNSTVDKINKQVRVTTTHFSDWTYFKSMQLNPSEATVALGGSVDLKVTTTFPYMDPDDAPPGDKTTPVYTAPRELRPDEILGWTYSGDGILISQAAKAFYTAPQEEPDTNPEAVTVKINMARKGQFLIVSNITVLSDKNIDYLHVDEDWVMPHNNGKCVLYLYGNFGNDPGAGKRSVTIDGTQVDADLWAPTLIRCRIDQDIFGAIEVKSNGNVVAKSVLRKFTGSIFYERFHGGVANAGSSNPLKETTRFDLVYRGFGKPCPPHVNALPVQLSLANGTDANFTLGGSASVTQPGTCPITTSTNLPTAGGIQPLNPLSVQALSGFKAWVEETGDGLIIEFKYAINNVIAGAKITRSNCNFTSESLHNLAVGMEGFEFKPIAFEFDGTSGLKLKNSPLQTGRMATSILIEAWSGEGNPSHYETDGLMKATLRNF